MKKIRHTDSNPKASLYRSERMIRQDGKWFFETREGSLEGPFASEADALLQLDRFIQAMTSGMLPEDNTLTLEPISEFTTRFFGKGKSL